MNPEEQPMQARCRICCSEAARHAFRSPLEKFTRAMGRTAGVDYYYCTKCTGLFQHPIFSASEYRQFYETVQRSDDTGYRSDEVPKKHIAKKRRDTEFKWTQLELLDILGMMPGNRAFEIGTGEGTLLASFRARGCAVRGIEPLARYACYAREELELEVESGYFDAATASRERADLVILDNVLEHMIAPYETLRLVRGMMNPDGIVYVSVPCAETATATNANVAHITLWTRRSLALVLTCAGFQPLAMIKGRPASRPHEWVCVSQACLEPVDIERGSPCLYPAVSFDDLSSRWHEMLSRGAEADRRRAAYGPAYRVLARLMRALRSARRLLRRPI